MLTVKAYAKINLTFEILGRRKDGYHEINSVLQTIDLTDVFSFEPADKVEFMSHDFKGIKIDLLRSVILKAADLLREETGCNQGALIRMESIGIPRAAGLGSSSTDSAAVLNGLNELWSLKLSADDLTGLSSKLGSDTPFFIRGGTALAEGRGEQITPLPCSKPFWAIFVIPSISTVDDKTAKMYGMISPSHFTNGNTTNNLVFNLIQGSPLSFNMMCNTFENVAFEFFPQLDQFRQTFIQAGAKKVHLAGAGPVLFALVPDEKKGEIILSRLIDAGLEAYLVCSV